jgi:hypothetical protein
VFPELQLQIEFEQGEDQHHDDPPVQPRVATRAHNLMDKVAVATTTARISDHSVAAAASPATAKPAPADANPEPDVPYDAATEDAPTPDDADTVATIAESYREVPVRAETAAETQEVPIPPSQQAVLTRRLIHEVQGLDALGPMQKEMSWEDGGRAYTAVLTRQPATDGTDIEHVSVEIATEEQGQRWRTRMEMKRLAFSHFTQLVDHWDSDVQLHDDEIEGRFHSNSEIVVGYDRKVAPRFLGKVTTAARGFTLASTTGYRRRDEIFTGGFETRAERIVFPARYLPLTAEQQNSNAEVHSFDQDTHITFHEDGSYGWMQERSQPVQERAAEPSTPIYFVGARDATLYVRGVISGKVLVYSPERVVIEGSLTYARDPRANPDSADYLGIVSDKYVEVAPPYVTGRGDLEIDAAIYARRRFIVTYEEARSNNAVLLIYGSLTAGSLSATEPRYATSIKFDPRFERLRPPGFPVTNRYEIESWNPQWQALGEARVQ